MIVEEPSKAYWETMFKYRNCDWKCTACGQVTDKGKYGYTRSICRNNICAKPRLSCGIDLIPK